MSFKWRALRGSFFRYHRFGLTKTGISDWAISSNLPLQRRCARKRLLEGPLTVRMEDGASNVLASAQIGDFNKKWATYTVDLTPSATDPKGGLAIEASGSGELWMDMVSLMPQKSWKGHGLRPDLCQMLDAMKPSFVRFPGGCWVEGEDMAHMYHWKNTIGDVASRTPLYNIWGYMATHGLGFHEYLQMSEDLGAAPLFCVNIGMSHKDVVPMDQMGQWVQDAVDSLEYANGPTNTLWGSLRAKNGHPAPFHLKYMEIGNENGGPAYHERWPLFHDAVKARYPDVQLIADVWNGYPTNPAPNIVDEHYYDTPEFFMREAKHYDNYDRKGPKIFVGEYAVTKNCGLGYLRAAVGEAAFMTGLERNSDIVVMASYAPLFVNMNHRKWNPDLINFDNSRVYGLPSYYVQQMFCQNQGEVVLPVSVQAPSEEPVVSGTIGVGTWDTQAEFKDLKVTCGGQVLYSANFTNGTSGLELLGDGEWTVQEGVLRQSSQKQPARAIVNNCSWSNCTYSLKARKISGSEGFLILFGVNKNKDRSWRNLGGWGNGQHGIETEGLVVQSGGHIETGRWYDIRIETEGSHIKCFLDENLIHDVESGSLPSLFASAMRDGKTGELILKVVNASAKPMETDICLNGAGKIGNAKATVLSASSSNDENSLENPLKIAPKTETLQITDSNFHHAFPANSVTVLRMGTQ